MTKLKNIQNGTLRDNCKTNTNHLEHLEHLNQQNWIKATNKQKFKREIELNTEKQTLKKNPTIICQNKFSLLNSNKSEISNSRKKQKLVSKKESLSEKTENKQTVNLKTIKIHQNYTQDFKPTSENQPSTVNQSFDQDINIEHTCKRKTILRLLTDSHGRNINSIS